MSELFDKEVNVQKKFEKTSSVYASSRRPTKVCDENETKKQEKNDERLKYFLMEGRSL